MFDDIIEEKEEPEGDQSEETPSEDKIFTESIISDEDIANRIAVEKQETVRARQQRGNDHMMNPAEVRMAAD